MRYDTPIFFQKTEPGAYDPKTGNYGNDQVVETKALASVMDTSTKTMQLLYGSIKQGSLTIHLQNHYTDIFDKIKIDNKVYRVDYSRKLRTKHVFVLSEV